MITRTIAWTILATLLALLLVACGSSPTATEPTQSETAVLPTGLAQENAETAPCTPVGGSTVASCEPGPSVFGEVAASVEADGGVSMILIPEALELRYQLTAGKTLHGHIVVRGTYLPDTTRCVVHDGLRYPPQRQTSSSGLRTIKCYADVRVHEYIIGAGPPVLTVIADVLYYLNYYEFADLSILPPDKENENEQEYIERLRVFYEQRLGGGEDNEGSIEGREAMLFLGPSLDISVEAWEVMRQWRLEQRDEGTVVAVHPIRDDWRAAREDFQQYRSQLEMELPAFRQAITTAHQARVTASDGRVRPEADYPMLVTDANQLSEYFREVGAYDDPDNPPAQPPPVTPASALSSGTPTPTPTATPTTAPTATPTVAPTATPSGMAEIPPCTPVPGSSVDPCEAGRGLLAATSGSVSALLPDPPTVPYSVGDYLDGFGWSNFTVGHVVVRGTYLPGTVRCTSGNSFRLPLQMEPSPDEPPNILRNLLQIYCYADVRVNAYIVGTGPSVLTAIVAFDKYGYHGYSYYEPAEVEALRAAWELALIEGGTQLRRPHVVTGPSGGIIGREAMLFLTPSTSTSVEAWRVYRKWNVQRREDGTAVAVHPDVSFYQYQRPHSYESLLPQLELTLPAFGQAATTAHEARVAANGGRVRPDPAFPMFVSDASQLATYFREVGAYSDPASPPAQPPPVLTCPNGAAVTDPNTNWRLVQDCEALLAAKDTLRGTATLNWSKDLAIGSWDGITTSGTPSRVTEVDLSSESLSGTIPADLGTLFELTTLDLSSNSLTGSIPHELGWLSILEELRLSGNSLTGCIPVALEGVATNDLSSLNLLYCAPPAPGNLSAGTRTQTSVALSWNTVANTSNYRVEYRLRRGGDWAVDTETVTAASHTVDELECDRWYHFRVSAYGSGTTYAAAWSESSEDLVEKTSVCTATESDEES